MAASLLAPLWMASSDLYSSQKSSLNSLRRNWMLRQPLLLVTGCLSIQFFDSPLKQSVKTTMATYLSLCSTCVTYGTSCHAISHQVLPTQPIPREEEDFPRGQRHFKYVLPLTYLIYLSPKGIQWQVLFMHIRPLSKYGFQNHGTCQSLPSNLHY